MSHEVLPFRRRRASSARPLRSSSAISKMSPASTSTQREVQALLDRQQKLALANPSGAKKILKAFAALLTLSGV